jgi:hypothetical protein
VVREKDTTFFVILSASSNERQEDVVRIQVRRDCLLYLDVKALGQGRVYVVLLLAPYLIVCLGRSPRVHARPAKVD